MKFLPLVWAMLWRRKVRTVLTFASIAVAFMLFGMLQAFGSVFLSTDKFLNSDLLFVTHRYGFLKGLPYAHRGQIEAVDGVATVSPVIIVPATFAGDPVSGQASLAVDPATGLNDARIVVTPEHLQAFGETRTGVIAGRELAAKYGWKIGDRIPVVSPRIKRRDGAAHWEFDIVGLFNYNAELMGEGVSAMRVLMRYDYVDEARMQGTGTVDLYFVDLERPGSAPAVIKAIDTLFQNSAHPTRTQTEAEQQRSQLKQLGDIGLIITAILSAVFFTLVVIAANTMMRAFRERIPELGVLKTIGYTDRTVATLVAVESLLLCVAAGLAGLGVAWLVLKPLAKAVAAVLPLLRMEPETVVLGATLAVALGIAAAVAPVWQSTRLTIVDALAGR